MKKIYFLAFIITLLVNISFADDENCPQNDFVLRQVMSVYNNGTNDELLYASKLLREMHQRNDIIIEARPLAKGVEGNTKIRGKCYIITVNSDLVGTCFLNDNKNFYDLIIIILSHEFQHVLDFDKSETFVMAETLDKIIIPFLKNGRYVPDGLKRIRELYRQCGDCAVTEKWHDRLDEVYK